MVAAALADNEHVGMQAASIGAVCCLCFGWLQHFSGNLERRFVITVMLGSIFVTTLLPFAILAAWPGLYANSGLDNALLYGVSDNLHIETLIFVSACAISFWVGAHAANVRRLHERIDFSRSAHYALFVRRIPLLRLTLVAYLLRIAMAYFLGTQQAGASDEFGAWTRLLPVDIFFLACVFVLVKHGQRTGRAFRLGFGLVVVLALVLAFQSGVRGIVLQLFVLALLSYCFAHPSATLRPSRVVGVSLVVALLLPVPLAIVSESKNRVTDAEMTAEAFDVQRVMFRITDRPYHSVFAWIAGRLSGYQVFIKARSGLEAQMRDEISFAGVAKSFVATIVPDRWLPEGFIVPTLGQMAGVVIDGHSYNARHAGAWFGMTMLWVYCGWLALPIMIAVGWLSVSAAQLSAGLGELWTVAYLKVFVSLSIIFMLSGNIDTLAGSVVVELAVAAFSWILLSNLAVARPHGHMARPVASLRS